MGEFHIKNINQIDLGYGNQINHFAFDGCNYYFTVTGERKIIKTDKNFEVLEVYNTYREYDCICFDCKKCCFYVSCKKCCTCVYKLDCCMREVGCITVRNCCNTCIVGMCCNCGNDTIILAFSNSIYEMKKNCGECMRVACPSNYYITGVLSIYPGYIVTAMKDKKYYIFIIDQCGKVVISSEVECGVIIQDMIFNPCDERCNINFVDCLVVRELTDMCITRQPLSDNDLGFNICPCNYDLCHKCCCDEKPCDHLDPCGDILKSIALIEAALSHILNAEGEKIQKAVELCTDVNELLCVNKSVANTISKVTFLEQVLHAKLETVMENCCCDDLVLTCESDCNCLLISQNQNRCKCFEVIEDTETQCESDEVIEEVETQCESDEVIEKVETQCESDEVIEEIETQCDSDGVIEEVETQCESDEVIEEIETQCDSDEDIEEKNELNNL